jgi:hypothetical protein
MKKTESTKSTAVTAIKNESNSPHIDLINALAEMENVVGNKINPAFKSRYVTLDALLDAIKPTLHRHNLAFVQNLLSDDGRIGVQTAFLHTSGHLFDFGRLMINATNLDAQKIGGALTYIRRQSIQTACGISIDHDDDGNSSHGNGSQNKTQTYSTGVFKPQGSQTNTPATSGQATNQPTSQPTSQPSGQPNFQIRK